MKKIISKIIDLIYLHAETKAIPYKLFGIFCLITYPTYYLIWSIVSPTSYENFTLRFIVVILSFGLIFHRSWRPPFDKYLPIYWYLTVLYALPFLFSFLLFKNNFSETWMLNCFTVVVLTILLLDSLALIFILPVGILSGWITYRYTTLIVYTPSNIASLIITYLSVIIFGLLFSNNKEKIVSEKLKTLTAIGASIAHELRTPLRTIMSSTSGLKKQIPKLIQTYDIADQHHLDIPFIDPEQKQSLTTSCEFIENEVKSAFTFIDMLLIKASQNSMTPNEQKLSMAHCISQALDRYPFDLNERELVKVDSSNDFNFIGDENLVTHLFFNLLKNALYYIRAARKGNITIRIEATDESFIVYFKDTGQGIPSNIIPYIFERFFSRTRHGTGLGLYFCKMAMESMQGKIKCVSQLGEYTEFQLIFPKKSLPK